MDMRSITAAANERFLSVTRSVVALALVLKVKPADFAKAFADNDGQEEFLLEALPTYLKEVVRQAKEVEKKQ